MEGPGLCSERHWQQLQMRDLQHTQAFSVVDQKPLLHVVITIAAILDVYDAELFLVPQTNGLNAHCMHTQSSKSVSAPVLAAAGICDGIICQIWYDLYSQWHNLEVFRSILHPRTRSQLT